MARLGLTFFEDHSLLPYLVAPILYLGPLYATFLASKLPFQSRWSWGYDVFPVFNTWVGIRNYFFGPITEELVFRACVLAVYHLAGSSKNKMIFLSPLLFGLGRFKSSPLGSRVFIHVTQPIFITPGRCIPTEEKQWPRQNERCSSHVSSFMTDTPEVRLTFKSTYVQ